MDQKHIKYPRTFHCPWSPGRTNDDKVHTQSDINRMFKGREVVVTEKMDGENSSLYSDGCHARSLDSRAHVSQAWIRAFAAKIGQDIPEGWRVCGENLYARHALGYDSLPSYFLGFGIYNEVNRCMPWDTTVEWAALLGVDLVPVLYRGPWNQELIQALGNPGVPSAYGPEREGYVVRLADGFDFWDFDDSVAKYVRSGHVDPNSGHWAQKAVVPNGLKA